MIDKAWLDTCITAGEFLYGEYPVSVLQELCTTKGQQISKEQIAEFYDSGSMMVCDGEMVSPLIATEDPVLSMFKEADEGGNPYASLHFDLDELKYLRKENSIIEDQPYWIPTAAQIEDLMENGYIRTPAMTVLEKKVKSVGGDPSYLKSIWARVCTGKLEMMEAISAVLSGMFPQAAGLEEGSELPPEKVASIPTIDDLNAMMPMVNDYLNNINNRNRNSTASRRRSSGTLTWFGCRPIAYHTASTTTSPGLPGSTEFSSGTLGMRVQKNAQSSW